MFIFSNFSLENAFVIKNTKMEGNIFSRAFFMFFCIFRTRYTHKSSHRLSHESSKHWLKVTFIFKTFRHVLQLLTCIAVFVLQLNVFLELSSFPFKVRLDTINRNDLWKSILNTFNKSLYSWSTFMLSF